VSRKYQ